MSAGVEKGLGSFKRLVKKAPLTWQAVSKPHPGEREAVLRGPRG